jgi:hypothetical protein
LALSTHDHPTIEEREKPEGSCVEGSVEVTEKKEEGEGEVEKEGEKGEEEEDEDEEEDISKWGPLKVPVTLKIADLGNACWVVRI